MFHVRPYIGFGFFTTNDEIGETWWNMMKRHATIIGDWSCQSGLSICRCSNNIHRPSWFFLVLRLAYPSLFPVCTQVCVLQLASTGPYKQFLSNSWSARNSVPHAPRHVTTHQTPTYRACSIYHAHMHRPVNRSVHNTELIPNKWICLKIGRPKIAKMQWHPPMAPPRSNGCFFIFFVFDTMRFLMIFVTCLNLDLDHPKYNHPSRNANTRLSNKDILLV